MLCFVSILIIRGKLLTVKVLHKYIDKVIPEQYIKDGRILLLIGLISGVFSFCSFFGFFSFFLFLLFALLFFF